jgi:hypothetical protein
MMLITTPVVPPDAAPRGATLPGMPGLSETGFLLDLADLELTEAASDADPRMIGAPALPPVLSFPVPLTFPPDAAPPPDLMAAPTVVAPADNPQAARLHAFPVSALPDGTVTSRATADQSPPGGPVPGAPVDPGSTALLTSAPGLQPPAVPAPPPAGWWPASPDSVAAPLLPSDAGMATGAQPAPPADPVAPPATTGPVPQTAMQAPPAVGDPCPLLPPTAPVDPPDAALARPIPSVAGDAPMRQPNPVPAEPAVPPSQASVHPHVDPLPPPRAMPRSPLAMPPSAAPSPSPAAPGQQGPLPGGIAAFGPGQPALLHLASAPLLPPEQGAGDNAFSPPGPAPGPVANPVAVAAVGSRATPQGGPAIPDLPPLAAPQIVALADMAPVSAGTPVAPVQPDPEMAPVMAPDMAPEMARNPILPPQGPVQPQAMPAFDPAQEYPDAEIPPPPQGSAIGAGSAGMVQGGAAALPQVAAPGMPPQSVAPILAQIARTGEPGTVELTLVPEDLGTIRITLTTDGENLRMVVQADRPETLDLFRRGADHLWSELRQSGFTGASLTFADSRGQAPGQPRPPPEHPGDDPPATGFAPPRPPANLAMGGLNLRL